MYNAHRVESRYEKYIRFVEFMLFIEFEFNNCQLVTAKNLLTDIPGSIGELPKLIRLDMHQNSEFIYHVVTCACSEYLLFTSVDGFLPFCVRNNINSSFHKGLLFASRVIYGVYSLLNTQDIFAFFAVHLFLCDVNSSFLLCVPEITYCLQYQLISASYQNQEYLISILIRFYPSITWPNCQFCALIITLESHIYPASFKQKNETLSGKVASSFVGNI